MILGEAVEWPEVLQRTMYEVKAAREVMEDFAGFP
jgi:hypothetical protein